MVTLAVLQSCGVPSSQTVMQRVSTPINIEFGTNVTQAWFPVTVTVALPFIGRLQSEAVNVSPVSTSAIGMQTVIGVSSGVVTAESKTTGGSFTGVTVMAM